MKYVLPFFLLLTVTYYSNAITLDSAITRSDSCVAIEWTPDSINTDPTWYRQYGSLCTGTDSIYKQCDFIPGRTYRGVAYSYGGEDPWFLFRNRLEKGFLVGSHQCHYKLYSDPSDKVTGSDCSGFLSFVWDVPRVSTTTFLASSAYVKVSLSDIKAGDALVKASPTCGYHAIFIVEADTLTEVVVSEASSTVFGCRERLVDLTSPAWSCYTAIRNPALVNTHTTNIPATHSLHSNYTISIKPQLIKIQMNNQFTGNIGGFLPSGARIFKKTVLTPVRSISIDRSQIHAIMIILTFSPFTYAQETAIPVIIH